MGIRSGFFKECQIKTPEQLSLGGLIRLRKQLVEQRVQLQNSIRGTLKPFGINLKAALGKTFLPAVHEMLPILPEVISAAIMTVLQCLASVMKSIEDLSTRQKFLNHEASL